MKAVIFIIAAGTTLSATDELAYRFAEFDHTYEPVVRAYFGCPPDGFIADPRTECKPALGKLDRRGWEKAREAAKRLFDLGEK